MNYYQSLNASDKLTVTINYVSTQYTKDILNTLYVPLIGLECIGLYHYLTGLIKGYNQVSDEHTHYVFLNDLGLHLELFESLRHKLEAIGLLKTYIKSDDIGIIYVYKLITPVYPSMFFNDPMLSVFLFQKVGHQRFLDIKSKYLTESIDVSEYQDVSKKYMDVFGTPKNPEKSIYDYNQQLVKDSTSYGIPIHQETFDFDMLEMLLSQNLVTKQQLTKEVRQLITQLAMLYELSPTEMRPIILKSLTSNQTISHEDLRKNARDYYTIEHEGALPELQEQVKFQINEVNSDSSLLSWFEYMDTTSPIEMLRESSEAEPTIKQKRMIEQLIEREKLPFGVVNMLLQYVMLTKDMQLPQSYIEEVASNWKKLKLNSSKAAFDHVQKLKEKRAKRQTVSSNQKSHTNFRNQNKIEKTPVWLTQQQEDKDVNQEDLKQKQEALLKKLNHMWKEEDE